MSIETRSRRTNKKQAQKRAKAHDARLLAKAERETREGTAMAELSVPMTLSEVCEVIGRDCKPEKFGSTALETLAGQLDGLTTIADANSGVGTYDQWRIVDNVVSRMRLAANVAAWLESETPEAAAKLPQVQP